VGLGHDAVPAGLKHMGGGNEFVVKNSDGGDWAKRGGTGVPGVRSCTSKKESKKGGGGFAR